VSTASRQAGPIEVRINYTDWAVTPALHLITAYTGAKSPPIADPQSREALLRLLAGGPKVAIEQLYLFTPQGEFDGTLLLDFPKGSPLFKPNTSLRKAQARGTLRIDDTLAQEIGGALLALLIQETFPADPQGLDPTWIQQKVIHYLQQAERDGILHRNDGLLSSSFQLDDAKLSINGIPQPLPFTPSSHSVN
jgi:uncharacterized protein YdgA (DUF945 family)